jgi:hypothetical protein
MKFIFATHVVNVQILLQHRQVESSLAQASACDYHKLQFYQNTLTLRKNYWR